MLRYIFYVSWYSQRDKPGMRESKSFLLASSDNLVPRKGGTPTASKLSQYFAKYARNQFLLKLATTNFFHHLRQKHTVEFSQIMKEEMLTPVDV